MCIILDANCFSKLVDHTNDDMKPVRDWLEKRNGRIIYSDTHKFKQEWQGREKTYLLNIWGFVGKLKRVDRQQVEAEANRLKSTRTLNSNDEHIIALARVTEVKVLVSDDKKLHKDFKNRNLVGGKVYQQARHRHLLRSDMCP